jgi:hypothetical protein
LLEDVFRPDALCRRVREFDATTGLTNAAELCARITRRATELEFQLADRAALVELLPTPAFDDEGVARIAGWRPAPKLGQPRAWLSVASRDGAGVLHLQTTPSSSGTFLQTRFSLPAGLYRLAGRVAVAGAPPESDAPAGSAPVPVWLVRMAAARFAYDRRSLGSGDIDVTFRVSDSMAPEEIELTFEVPGVLSEAWIDASSLTLVTLDRSTP